MQGAAHFRTEAAKCRTLARVARDRMTEKNLLALAEEYEAQARQLEAESGAEPPMPRPE